MPEDSPDPIVVTGLGIVNAAGCGREPTAAALRDAAPAWSEVDRGAGYHRSGSARLAGLATGHDLSSWIKPAAARRMSQPSKLAVAAARMALLEAGIEPGEEVGGRPAAVMVSNAFGPSAYTEKILAQIEDEGPMAVSPALFIESVANAPAAQIALACRAHGANVTVTQREAGTVIALAQAAGEVARGRAGYALAVAVDEVTPLLHAVLDRYGALARPGRGGGEMPRPFDRRRDGYVLAEGATAVVLERASSAARRGAAPLARLLGTADAFDPTAPATAWGRDPETLARALRRLLGRAGVVEGDRTAAGADGVGKAGDVAIHAVVSGASGSVGGDWLEARTLRAAWGGRPLPPLLVPKAVLGEHGGAQLAAAVLALEGAPFGAVPGFVEVDPELGVAPHDGAPLTPSTILVSCPAVGGAAAWAVLTREES